MPRNPTSVRPRFALCVMATLIVLLGTGQAWAGEWSWSAGPRVGVAFSSFNVAPDTSQIPASMSGGAGAAAEIPVPDLNGVGGGIGFHLEFLYHDTLGLEVGGALALARATGSKTLGEGASATEVDFTLTSTEVHVPALLKLQRVVAGVPFFVGLGVTAAVQTKTELDAEPSRKTVVLPETATDEQMDLMPTFALGLRFPFGSVEVPVELRFVTAYEPEALDERFEISSDGTLNVDPSWTGQGWLSVGVAWHGGF